VKVFCSLSNRSGNTYQIAYNKQQESSFKFHPFYYYN
jgi:hypothetical protein